ncbi:hypothetical protein DUF421 [Gottschalkia acidurici 9a]|uniref:DUF421 domain-containing protein n=1 Tax=Gottschalkia acidurici (strain ATCC 7906 / DSM 604 / BCRC 14475 / CIP 104303 / KCTC 5404 / NCIMB 10678 / 9a) TaxID=1128398 RepID=K0AY45_GOTA9|nr:DUF421 domain-containing protein [Gottschalkia acidurici]AFS77680.1 hypothetical protein DUF421 [Gottschalkia acidurici 9a]
MKSLIEITIQTLLAFFSILYITRILGRQQVSQLTVAEYINGITFGSIAANLATDLENHTWQHLLGVILFGALTYFVNKVALKKRSLSKVFQGEPVLVIQDGQILERNLKRLGYNVDDLMVLLRQQDCFSPDDVEFGLIEMNGSLSIIKVGEKRNVTLGDLNITPSDESIPTELIIGGQIIYENLKQRKLTGKQLMKELNKYKIDKVSEVMYATVDRSGKFYVDKFKDNIRPGSDLSENNKGI